MPFVRAIDKTSVRLRLTLAVMAFLAGAFVCFYPSGWHFSPTFYYVNKLNVPWWLVGGLFLIAGVAILIKKIRPIGYLIGAIVYSFFSLSAWLVVIGGLHWSYVPDFGFPKGLVGSPFAAVNLTSLALVYWIVLRDAVYKQVDPELELTITGSTTG